MNYHQDELQRIQTDATKELVKEGYKYSLTVTAPDGAKTRTLNLSQEQLDKLIEIYE